jgi:hypothetical protein
MIRVVHPDTGTRIRILIFFTNHGVGSSGQKDTGFRIRIRITVLNLFFVFLNHS